MWATIRVLRAQLRVIAMQNSPKSGVDFEIYDFPSKSLPKKPSSYHRKYMGEV